MKVELLDNSNLEFGQDSFYQSKSWIKISESEKIKTHRILIYDKKNPVIYSSIFEYSIPYLGKYFFIPKGPLILDKDIKSAYFHKFYKELKILAKNNNISFCIIESDQKKESNELIINKFFQKYCADFPKNKLPLQTHILDLTLGKEKLLSNLKSKTRYNINLARKKGVLVEFLYIDNSNFQQNFDQFYKILEITSKRGQFGIHSKQHYLNILSEKSNTFKPFLAVAKFKDNVLAGNIMLHTKNQSIYLHGGSDNQKREFMAPYLLQWSCIEKALEENKQIYDFWGISDKKDSWSGITRFKRSFQGYDIDYLSPKVIIFNKIIFYLYIMYIRLKTR